jgi:hypothetical protein
VASGDVVSLWDGIRLSGQLGMEFAINEGSYLRDNMSIRVVFKQGQLCVRAVDYVHKKDQPT